VIGRSIVYNEISVVYSGNHAHSMWAKCHVT
jgi:hypothetical protein